MPYLRVTKTILIREMPLGTYLFVPYGFQLESFFPVIEIDEATKEVLKLCNGTRTQDEISQQFADESGEPVEEVAEALSGLVEYMVREGVLEWSEEPSHIEPIYNRDRPLSISMDITSACNLQCPFCSANAGAQRSDDLTLDDIIPLVEQLRILKPTPFAISGGEPLLKKDILLYMVKALSPIKEMAVTVFTNGTLITKDYAQQLYDAGLRVARVSVDGHTERLHDTVRGKGTFKRTIQGIHYLRELGIHVNTVSVISRINYPYINEIRHFVAHLSDTYNMVPVIPVGRGSDTDLLLNPREMFTVKATPMGPGKIQTGITPRNRCNAGETIYIASNGDIFPCLYLNSPGFKVGNIRDTGLCEIYENGIMQDILKLTINDLDDCASCDIRYYCGGGCRGLAHSLCGSLYAPDPTNCEQNKMLIHKILENGEENTKRLLQELLKSTKELG